MENYTNGEILDLLEALKIAVKNSKAPGEVLRLQILFGKMQLELKSRS